MKYLPAIIAFYLGCLAAVAMGATANFEMHGNFSQEFISQAEHHAEHCRKALAIEWLGSELPQWATPCRVELVNENHSGGGATFFGFDSSGKGFDFEGRWRGRETALINDVIPHEVLHTVLASHFGPVPRWADEGAAMNCETPSGTGNFESALMDALRTGAFSTHDLLRFTEYPQRVPVFYGQSYSLTKFLIQHNGKAGFVEFLADAMPGRQYDAALKKHFGIESEWKLQDAWLDWLKAGQPIAPHQLAMRSVSYAGPCRYVWNGRCWVQQCDPGSSQPSQPVNTQPLQPTPPKPVKECNCDNAALIARITALEAKITILEGQSSVPGPPGPEGKQGPGGPAGAAGKDGQSPSVDVIVAEVIKQIPPCKPCECNSGEEPATRPGAPAFFDIEPRKRF